MLLSGGGPHLTPLRALPPPLTFHLTFGRRSLLLMVDEAKTLASELALDSGE